MRLFYILASSLQESMSIRVPSSRGPKEDTHSSFISQKSEINEHSQPKDSAQSINMYTSPNSNILNNGTGVNSRQSMELAVSSLAKAQQAEVQKLIQHQEKERLALKTLFEQQQRRLIQVRINKYFRIQASHIHLRVLTIHFDEI